MEKRERLIHIIEQFEKNAKDMSNEVMAKLTDAKNQLYNLSVKEVEMLDGATIIPADEREYSPDNPIYVLNNTFDKLEEYTKSNTTNTELYHALQELRGILGTPDRYY